MSRLYWRPTSNRGGSNRNHGRYNNYGHRSFNKQRHNHQQYNGNKNNQREISAQNAMEFLSKNKHLYSNNKQVWMFSFGANMDSWKLETKRNIKPIGKKLRGKLIGWKLRFDHRGGFANVIKVNRNDKNHNFKSFIHNKQSEVHGVLMQLHCNDLIKLARMEHGYELYEVSVKLYVKDICDAMPSSIQAVAFKTRYCFQTKISNLWPTTRYIGLIRRGAEQMNLNKDYRNWLDMIQSINGKDRGKEYYDVYKNQ
eukprot:512265_1